MKKTQRLITLVGDTSLINLITEQISGFHACMVIKAVSDEILQNVFYYNKNAIYFAPVYPLSLHRYNPIILRIKSGYTVVDSQIVGTLDTIKGFREIMDTLNVDIGDHCSEDSSNINFQSTENCLLCKIYEKTTEHVEHILYETTNFYVVPGTGAFFDGYLMIVPKSHVMSFALLPHVQRIEFFNLLNDIRSILEGVYGKKVFAFECSSGRTGAGKHKTSIVHAHFHLAPTDMPVLKEVQKSGLHPAIIKKEELSQYGEHPYMLYVDQEDNWFISCDPHDYYPRQHPRQVLAEYMGLYNIYNWRIYPFREKMDVIADEFRDFCSVNYDSLPSWVQESVRFED